MGINYQTNTYIVIYAHNTLLLSLCTISAALVYFASHSEVPPLQFLSAFPTAVSGFMRLCCSGSRYPGWPSALHIATCHRIIFNINPLNTELNPICHLLALLEAHHIVHVSGLRVNA